MASTNVMFREPPGTTGSARHLSEREVAPRPSEANLGQVERVASAALGGTLLMFGLGRRSLGGAAVAALGGGLVYGIATGHCHLYQALGVNIAADRGSADRVLEDAREAIMAVRKGGVLSILGVYMLMDKFPSARSRARGLTVRSTQQHGQKYMLRLLGHAAKGQLDPSFLATRRFSLEDGPRGYAMFKHKEDGCVRSVFAP
jgi:threonine dehydrogenase-like Zn-dependent dehydrogenase